MHALDTRHPKLPSPAPRPKPMGLDIGRMLLCMWQQQQRQLDGPGESKVHVDGCAENGSADDGEEASPDGRPAQSELQETRHGATAAARPLPEACKGPGRGFGYRMPASPPDSGRACPTMQRGHGPRPAGSGTLGDTGEHWRCPSLCSGVDCTGRG